MSKIIKFSQEMLDEILKDFISDLSKSRMFDGKITYTKTFGEVEAKTKLYFTEVAWLKMKTLVREFDKEVAWHGTAERTTVDGEDGYLIRDIYVYPQVVSGATVNTDQEKYQTWLYEFDDEIFNNMKMQGHSHVNMGVTPSSVDDAFYEEILEMVEPDSFYIFMIWNKKWEKTIKIYDLGKNILFDTKDVEVYVLTGEYGLEEFLDSAKEAVTTRTYQAPATTYQTPKTSYYGAYSNTNATKTSDTKASAKDDNKKEKKGKKKGIKPKEEAKPSSSYTYYGYDDYDEDYDAYWYHRRGY